MNNAHQNSRGFVTVAPPHLQGPKLRFLFSGLDESTQREVFVTFTPLLVPGCVAPDDFADDVALAIHLPGSLTMFAPKFDLGRFTYFRPGSGSQTTTEASDPKEHIKDSIDPRPPKTPPSQTKQGPAKTTRNPEPMEPGF